MFATPLAAQPGKSWLQQEPFGLALILGTWNYPFQQILLPLAGALAAGNAAVVKLPEIAVQSASLMARHLEQYVDPGAVIVFTGGPETASRLLAQRFDKIFLYRFEPCGPHRDEGRGRAPHAGDARAWRKESGSLLLPDAPLEVTARRIAWGRFINAGQICVAPDYVLVPEPLRLPLIDSLGRAILRFYRARPASQPHPTDAL